MTSTTRDCSSYRHRLGRVTTAMDDLNESGNKALHDAYDLSKKRDEIYAQIIQAEMLLAGSWQVRSTDDGDLILESADYDEEFSPPLQKLLSPDYHEEYRFWGHGIALRFDDGTVTLRFPQDKAGEFIIDHHINIDLGNLVKNRDTLAEKLAVAEKLLVDMETLRMKS